MIYLYYGSDLAASRREFLRYKAGFPEGDVVSLSEDTKPAELISVLSCAPLFSSERNLTLEFFSASSPLLKDKNLSDYLSHLPSSSNLAFWVGTDLPESSVFLKTLKKLKAEIFQFKGKKAGSVFPFLTALLSGSRKSAYWELLKLLRDEQNEFFILTMITWQIRQLLTYLYNPKSPSIPAYTKSSLSRLSGRFSISQVEGIYRHLHRVDVKSKSGGDLVFELFKFVETVNE